MVPRSQGIFLRWKTREGIYCKSSGEDGEINFTGFDRNSWLFPILPTRGNPIIVNLRLIGALFRKAKKNQRTELVRTILAIYHEIIKQKIVFLELKIVTLPWYSYKISRFSAWMINTFQQHFSYIIVCNFPGWKLITLCFQIRKSLFQPWIRILGSHRKRTVDFMTKGTGTMNFKWIVTRGEMIKWPYKQNEQIYCCGYWYSKMVQIG